MPPTSRARSVSVSALGTRLVREANVGPWRIGDERVAGRCGTTYMVTHKTSGDRAALEVYDAAPLAFGSYVEKLRTWMHALNRLRHPGVVKIHDVGTVGDGRPYVVREHVDGTPLSALVAAKRLAEDDAIAILRAICSVLVTAHHEGVVHRALEPEHVIVLADRSVKLLDWGISDELAHSVKPGTNGLRHNPCASDDVYGFGVLVHRLLERIPPSLEPVWMSTLATDTTVRPTMPVLERELAALPTSDLRRTQPRVSPPARVEAPVEKLESAVRAVTQPEIVPASPAAIAAVESVVISDVCELAEPAANSRDTAGEPDELDEIAAPPRKMRSRIWQAAALASACAAAIVALVLMSSAADDSPRAARAATLVEHRPSAPAAVARTQPPTVQPVANATAATHFEPPVAEAATATREPATSRARRAVAPPPPAIAESPAPRVAAKASPTANRTKLAPAAVKAVAMNSRDDAPREALLVQYQRVGRNLLLAKRDLGPEAVAHVSKRFQWIKLDSALATATSRRLMVKTLQQLQAQIDTVRQASR